MKRIISLILLILILLLVRAVFPVNRGIVPGVLKPEMIRVLDDELFVVEGAAVWIYSLKDLKLKRKIGRQGEGPGELKKTRNTNAFTCMTKISNN